MTPPTNTSSATEKELHILVLSGRGFYTAAPLVKLEKMLRKPLGRHFALIAGTSVGDIPTVGLGYELSVQQQHIQATMEDRLAQRYMLLDAA